MHFKLYSLLIILYFISSTSGLIQEHMLSHFLSYFKIYPMDQPNLNEITRFYNIPSYSLQANSTWFVQMKYFLLHVSKNYLDPVPPNVGFLSYSHVRKVVKAFEKYDFEQKCVFNKEMLIKIFDDISFNILYNKEIYKKFLIFFAADNGDSINYLQIFYLLTRYFNFCKNYHALTYDYVQ
ncbi:uncharacterized protein LOC126898762 [Daktulosphaira vitifoliae]|uniref:uncharacterized protein LOC126898762 n=1 Tax=Daktulosphaira vitifoliae TaxID=58002 RepID=UPI0021AA5681|nr:uncharacterized protein LOC126898762 [Daktulosphaira vitifoliae]